MCLPQSITFCDAPLSRPLSQRALLPVGSSSTSSLVLGGNLTCVERGKKNQQAAEKQHNLWRTLVLSERLVLWTLQEPLYTYSRIIQVPLQNSLSSYMTTVLTRPITHHSETQAGPHNQPLQITLGGIVKPIWRWFPLRKQFDGCGAGKLKRNDLCVLAKSCRRSIWHLLNSALRSTRERFRKRSKLCQKDHLFFPPPLLKSSQVGKCWLTKPTVKRKWQRKLNASDEV